MIRPSAKPSDRTESMNQPSEPFSDRTESHHTPRGIDLCLARQDIYINRTDPQQASFDPLPLTPLREINRGTDGQRRRYSVLRT
jgi:hypothetical protein